MSDNLEFIWSNTDFPYSCLIDQKRTMAFKEAIDTTVKHGDTVLEIGAGTGILSLFAAKAGAKKVYAVEIDPLLSRNLIDTVKQNGYEGIIEVVAGDVFDVELPKRVDVIIGELIETGLLDEMQVKVTNYLHQKGIVGPRTKMIPQSYRTEMNLVQVSNEFYGFKIYAPIHNWPNYDLSEAGWAPLRYIESSTSFVTSDINFENSQNIQSEVSLEHEFTVEDGTHPNGLKISGFTELCDGLSLGACNTYSGDKILPMDFEVKNGKVKIKIDYVMGEGLPSLRVKQIN